MDRRILALDFDGVIWDTQREGYVMGQKVWRSLFGRWAFCPMELFLSGRWLARTGGEFGLLLRIGEELCLKLAAADTGAVEKIGGGRLNNMPASELFSERGGTPGIAGSGAAAFLAVSAGEGVSASAGCSEAVSGWCRGEEPWNCDPDAFPAGISDLSLQDYSMDAFKECVRGSSGFLEDFGRRLAEERALAQTGSLEEWLRWQNIYPETADTVQELGRIFCGMGICTTKDCRSVAVLLQTAGIKLPILAKEYSPDKRVQLRTLAASFGAEVRHVLFVDDVLDNLLHVRSTGVQTALAGWGYNNETSRIKAAEMGIPVLASLKEAAFVLHS